MATARDIAVAVNSVESKTGVVASAFQRTLDSLLPLMTSADAFTVVSLDLYGMNSTAVPRAS